MSRCVVTVSIHDFQGSLIAEAAPEAAQGVMRGWALSLGPRPSTSGGTRSPPPPPLLHRRRSGFMAADICDQLVPMSISC